jgi:hypothetical protein
MIRLLAWLSSAFALVGCMTPSVLPSPPPPPRIEPSLREAEPREPPPSAHGRLVLDAHGEPASVSRATEIRAAAEPETFGRFRLTPGPLVKRREEPLCITPCAVDLRQGWHQLVFRSRTDPTKSSVADVAVTANTTVVRHAIGREPHITKSYTGGLFLLVAGAGLGVVGGASLVAAAEPTPRADGSPGDGTPFLVTGLVLLGLGVALGTTGGALMASHHPVEQPGATTQWRRE